MCSTMQGHDKVFFTELFADTVKTHGVSWAHSYYCLKHGMPEWEFIFWRKSMLGLH